ncbi:MAG TPA: ribonuclease HII [bacterium]|nr:ribonuclease HII [bacterium]
MPRSLIAFDEGLARDFDGRMAGIDEAGRGPLAGPVVAAAVIFFRKNNLSRLNDSKKLMPKTREFLFREIAAQAIVGIGTVDEKQIDEINIYQATRLAMKRAVLALSRTPDLLLIDGNIKLDLPLTQQAIVKGDQKSAAIAAASIIAKVFRDACMNQLDLLYPQYGFKDHKGYATPGHLTSLQKEGPSPVHRKSFAPVRDLLAV